MSDTIRKYKLLKKKDKVLVGVSGGKDSLTALHLLHKFGYNPEALAIDEGIAGYRAATLEDAKKFCRERAIKLRVVSYEQEYGKKLDDIMKERKKNACSPCGAFRRHSLNKYSQGYDKLATGHNADDEAQTVLINLFKAQTQFMERQGPITTKKKGFVQRVKPLYFMKEKEVMTYSYLNGIKTTFAECPYSKDAYRIKVRDLLNEYAEKNPGTKENLVKTQLWLKAKMKTEKKEMKYCSKCGAPSAGEVCKSCEYGERY